MESISRPIVGAPPKKSLAQQAAVKLYSTIRQRQIIKLSDAQQPVTLVCISDTHNNKPALLPAGDILVHAGDLSQYGTFPEIQAQLSWLSAAPHAHKVVVAGNHDLLLDGAFRAAHPDRELERDRGHADLDWGEGLHYLEHEAGELRIEAPPRRVSVFGSPWTPRCGNWAFQYDDAFNWIGAIPDGVDIAVLHGPPKGHLDDGGKGCERLLEELWRARPAVVVCGHIHAGRGEEWLWYDNVQRWYDNVVLERRPWVSVLCLALVYVVVVVRWACGRPAELGQRRQCTHLVNAAMVREAVVLLI